MKIVLVLIITLCLVFSGCITVNVTINQREGKPMTYGQSMSEQGLSGIWGEAVPGASGSGQWGTEPGWLDNPYDPDAPMEPDSGWFNSSGQYPNQAKAWNRPMPGYFGSLPSSFGTQLSPAALAVLQSFFPAFNANAPTKRYEKTPAEKEVYSTSDEKDPTRTLLSPAQPATFGTTTTQMPELYSAQKMKQAQSMGAWEALMSYLGDVIGKQAKENWIQQSMAAGPSANKQRQPGWNVAKQR